MVHIAGAGIAAAEQREAVHNRIVPFSALENKGMSRAVSVIIECNNCVRDTARVVRMLAGNRNRLAAKIIAGIIIVIRINNNRNTAHGLISARRHYDPVAVVVRRIDRVLDVRELARNVQRLRLTERNRHFLVRIHRNRIGIGPQCVVVRPHPRLNDVIQLGKRFESHHRAVRILLPPSVIRRNAPITAYHTRPKLPHRNLFEANRNVRIGNNRNRVVV